MQRVCYLDGVDGSVYCERACLTEAASTDDADERLGAGVDVSAAHTQIATAYTVDRLSAFYQL